MTRLLDSLHRIWTIALTLVAAAAAWTIAGIAFVLRRPSRGQAQVRARAVAGSLASRRAARGAGARPGLSRRATLAISAAVGVACALSTVYTVGGLLPPHVAKRHVTVAAAAAHVLVDGDRSLLHAPTAPDFDYDGFSRRAALYGNLIASPPVADEIARQVGIAPTELATRARLTMPVQWAMRDPDLEQRANQIVVADRPYKLELQSDPVRPILTIYAQAPSVVAADRLADTTVAVLRATLAARVARDQDTPVDPAQGVTLTQLGPARGGVINGKIVPQIVFLMFSVGFGITLGLLSAGRAVRRGWRAAAAAPAQEDAPPAPALARASRGMRREPERARPLRGPGGDWPHTTRVMPWLIAGFFCVLWLVPFNAIQLSVSLPFDAKLDRLVLPVLFAFWLLTIAIGGPTAPRHRMTLIHVGLAIFVGMASLSIVTNALSLNQTLEFDQSFKKLTLLASYSLLFLIVASTVRRSEIAAFMKFILILSVLTAIGTIWEYRFHYNVFYDIPHRVLPGFFQIAMINPDARDDIGRVMTFGPTDHPLEVCGMLTMALPIALVGILGSKERRTRILYGLAACVLLAAAISTYRKSALLGPVAAIAVIAYFRRRELLRLAPLGFVSLAAIHVLSPGAFGSIVFQLHPDRLGVATVSDRASDYDAVRPDVWSHILFGRGYGSYDHLSYRILDSDMLSRLVDVGVLGTLAAIFMLICIAVACRATINARDPEWSMHALAVASAAVAFLVLGFLFDVTSFPHVPYILFSLAALAAVIVAGDDPALAGPAVVRRHRRRPGARSPRDPHLPRREPVPAGRRGGSSPRAPAFD